MKKFYIKYKLYLIVAFVGFILYMLLFGIRKIKLWWNIRQHSTGGSGSVNLIDMSHEIYYALTNMGVLLPWGLFTDGDHVIKLINSINKALVPGLADYYRQYHSRDLYDDLVNALSSSDYDKIKNQLN